jgi:hypothetical protein
MMKVTALAVPALPGSTYHAICHVVENLQLLGRLSLLQKLSVQMLRSMQSYCIAIILKVKLSFQDSGTVFATAVTALLQYFIPAINVVVERHKFQQ